MKPHLLALALLVAAACPAEARKPNDAQMLSLDPTFRVEQRCNARGMGVVGREHKPLHPDELVAYAYHDTAVKGAVVKAPGAAIRSGDTWYHLSYVCETSDDGLEIKSFQYALGEPIPKVEWGQHYLVSP